MKKKYYNITHNTLSSLYIHNTINLYFNKYIFFTEIMHWSENRQSQAYLASKKIHKILRLNINE